MLTGKQVRVRVVRNKLTPLYLKPGDPVLVGVAEQLLFAYREAAGRTRGETEGDLSDLLGDGPGQLVHQGLAKLLDDRCEYETVADLPPDAVREAAFRLSEVEHAAAAKEGRRYDRDRALLAVAAELGCSSEQADRTLFADLRDEQRVLAFADLTPSALLHRYNVALAQSVLLRSSAVEVRVFGETPARYRQLFRAVKFHRLICTVGPAQAGSYTLNLDGPLSLFSATLKYGVQLAQFLPTLLHCKNFDLRAEVLWGAQKKPKTFTLAATDGLRSHTADFGMYAPKELENLLANLRDQDAWQVDADPHPLPAGGTTWVPDFTLTRGKKTVHVELLGFWRKLDIEAHYQRLRAALPGRFVLVVSEAYRTDEAGEFASGPEVYRFKRTPVAAEVLKVAAAVSAG